MLPIWQILIAVNGQMLKNNLDIWSHWQMRKYQYAFL